MAITQFFSSKRLIFKFLQILSLLALLIFKGQEVVAQASASTSTVSASPSVIPTNGTTTLTVQLKDQNGANITNSTGITVTIPNPSAGMIGTIINNNNGTYTAIYTASTSQGSVVITPKLSGTTNFSNTVTVSVSSQYTLDGTSGSGSISHALSTNGDITVGLGFFVDYLVVGGGGGGGGNIGGGGGAGGFLTNVGGSPLQLNAQTYTVTVGAGGAGGNTNAAGANGSSSSVFNLTASGGGGGGFYVVPGGTGSAGSNGASGGGGSPSNDQSLVAGGGIATPAGQGFSGGSGQNSSSGYRAGGGGGASSSGINGSSSSLGNGGAGRASSITGSSVTYAGGGGGGGNVSATGSGLGVNGGGGAGGAGVVNGTAGTANTGGGGGGGGYNGGFSTILGGNGGSGVVILRYKGSSPNPGIIASTSTSTTVTPTSVLDDTYQLYQFTTTGSNTFNLTNAQPGTTLTNPVTGNGNLTYNGPGRLTMSADNSYSGTTSITAGNLQIGNGGTTGSLGDNAISITTGATLSFNRSNTITLSSSNTIAGLGTVEQIGSGTLDLGGITTHQAGTWTLRSGSISNGAISSGNYSLIEGTVSAVLAGTGTLTKTGGGTVTLSGNNTYSGSTTVSAGTLIVNGTHSGTGAVSVASGAALKGTGTLAGATTIQSGATLEPGNNAIGAISFGSGGLILAGGGHFNWRVNNTAGTAGTNWSTVNVTGTVSITATPGSKFNINVWSLLSNGTNGALTNFNSTLNSYSWTILTAGSIIGFDPAAFQINLDATNGTGGLISNYKVNGFSIIQDGNSLKLTYSPPIQQTIDGTNNATETSSYTTNTSAGSLTLNLGFFVDYLVVGGGGGGGGNIGGGGGAGGFLTNVGGSPLQLNAQTYTVTVGAGGAGGNTNAAGANGSSSSVFNLTASGGGGGGFYVVPGGTGSAGSNGASGGGGSPSNDQSLVAGGGIATPAGQGFSGGSGQNSSSGYRAGGGGGASSSGINGSSSSLGNGGAGRASSITGSSVTYAGGGGGGGNVTVTGSGTGGSGGGGAGGAGVVNGTAGTANTGGGGGGGGYNGGTNTILGGNGGSGIVVIRYPGASLGSIGGTVTSFTGNGTIGESGVTYNVHSFTSSGSFNMSGVSLTNRLSATLSGNVIGSGNLIYDGPGTLRLTGANTYSGTTTISSGTLQVGNASTTGTLGSGSVINNATLAFSRTDAHTVSNNISGTGAVNKLSSGALTLNGTLSYTGATTVSAGTLVAVSSLTSSSGLTVASGATLMGTGSLPGSTISGTHSPGMSPGVQTVNGNLTYNNGSTITWELISNSIGTRGTQFDGVDVVNGNLTFGSTVNLNLVFNSTGSAVDWTDAFWNTAKTGSSGWKIFQVSNGYTIAGLSNVVINAASQWVDINNKVLRTQRVSNGTFALQQVGNAVYLTYSPLPFNAFTISGINSVVQVNTPITGVQIRAVDANGGTVGTYTGTATLGGSAGIGGTTASFSAGVLSTTVTPTSVGSAKTLTVTAGTISGSTTFDVINDPLVTGSQVLDGTSGAATNSSYFSTTGGLTLSQGFFVDYLIVGGGGAGGNGKNQNPGGGGGGGAGGVLTNVGGTPLQLSAQTYSVTVGAGGVNFNPATGVGYNGGNSSALGITAMGGGGGGSEYGANPAANGGSGGGRGGNNTNANGFGTGITGQGNNGGLSVNQSGGGGGGASAAGSNASGTTGGAGGAGISYSITGSPVTYAGGGGGGTSGTGNGGSGGTGGGGAGGSSSGRNGVSGSANTGGGGGGAGGGTAGAAGAGSVGNGGSGIVILRYAGESVGAVGGTITSTASGSTLHTFSTVGNTNFNLSSLNLNNRLGTTLTQGISGSGDFTYSGPGRLILTANSTYTGNTTISNGTLQIGNGGTTGSLGTGSITNNAILSFQRSDSYTIPGAISGSGSVEQFGSGTLNLGGITTHQAGIWTLRSGTISNGTIASGNFSFIDGTVSAVLAGTGTLTKTGGGTVTLSGNNTYSGSTTVSAGTLIVNGTHSGTGAVSVASGAALKGTGTLAGATTIQSGATLEPGSNAIGTISFGSGGLTLAGGGHFNWRVNNTAGTAGTNWSTVNVTGTVSITATSGSKFNINVWSLLSNGTNGALTNFNPTLSSYSWTILTAAGGITGFAADKFQINLDATNGTGGLISNYKVNGFSIIQDGNSLKLTYSPPIQQTIDGTNNATETSSYTTNTSAGSLTLNLGFFVDYLVVGGGGGGGYGKNRNSGGAGGGGGGGVLAGTTTILANSYTITVGSGGAGSTGQNAGNGDNGGNSSALGFTSLGGGGGAGEYSGSPAGNGGSGGGGGGNGGTNGNGTTGQGFGGGAASLGSGSGGGGALAAGTNASGTTGGSGGAGKAFDITGSNLTYGGGGGGGTSGTGNAGSGGIGGGGAGGSSSGRNGVAGSANTGGGGGGAGGGTAGGAGSGSGAAGGSGVVIIRYKGTAHSSIGGTVTSFTGNGTIGQNGVNYNVHRFTSSSSFNMSSVSFNDRLNATLSGTIIGAGNLIYGGPGKLTLTGANTYTGTTSVTAGVLNLQNNAAAGTTAGGVSVSSGAALELQGGITVGAEALTINSTGVSNGGALRNISGNNTWGGTVTLGSASRINSDAGTLSLTAASSISGTNTNLTIGGAGNTIISGSVATGSGTLTKDGSGLLTLSGANTYTGTTTVAAGTLLASSSLTSSSSLTVASGATIKGTGSLPRSTISGTHAPGSSPGVQTVNGNLTYSTGSTLQWELISNNDNTTGARGTDFDGVDVTAGTLSISTGVNASLVFNATGSQVDFTDAFWLTDHRWLVYDNANAPTLANASTIFGTVTYTTDKNNRSLTSVTNLSNAVFSFVKDGNDIYLEYDSRTPELIVSTGTLSATTTCPGTASTARTFTVAGRYLTGSITLTAPSGFALSTNGSSYATSGTLTPTSGSVTTTTVYVRLTGASTGTYSGTVSVLTAGTATQTVAVSGTVFQQPSIAIHPSALTQTICQAGAATPISVTATGDGLTYQWYSNTTNSNTGGTLLAGAISSTYQPLTSAAGTKYYYCVVGGTCSPSVTSNVSGAITVVASSQGGTVSATATTVCSGNNTVTLTLTGSNGTINWQSSADGVNFIDIAGASSSTYTATNLAATTTYRAVVKNGICSSVVSANTVTVTVNPRPTASITYNSASFCASGTATVTRTGQSGGTYSSTAGLSIDASTGAINLSQSIAGTYTVTYSFSANGCNNTATTIVTILAAPTSATLSAGTASTTLCEGESIVLTASASSSNAINGFQWYKDNALMSGVVSSTYTALTGGAYFVKAVDVNGCVSAASGTLTVTVNSNPQATISQGKLLLFGGNCSSTTSNIVLTASTGVSYQWYSSSAGTISSIQNATAGTYTVTTPGDYLVKVTTNGCTSRSAITKVVASPSVSYTSNTICAGQSTMLNGSGYTLTTGESYEWQFSQDGVNNWAAASGQATAATYSATAQGYYRLAVIGGTVTQTSCPVSVTVNALPTISSLSASATTICAGQQSSLTVVTGTATPTYQWYLDNVSISGATASAYSASAAGTYQVKITDINGCVGTSSNTVISVTALPEAPSMPVGASICGAGDATLSFTQPSGAVYNWYAGSTGGATLNGTPSGTYTATSVAATTTYYAATVNAGCESLSRSPVTLTVNTVPTASISYGGSPYCPVGSAAVTLIGQTGGTFSSTTGLIINTNTGDIDLLQSTAGTHTVTYSFSNGICAGTATATITIQAAVSIPTITASGVTEFCQGNNVVLTASSADSYQWYRDGVSLGVTSSTYTATTMGNYTVRITSGACTNVESNITPVTVRPLPTISISPNTTICAGSSANLTASGASTYSWSPATGLSSSTISNPMATPSGTITYTVTGTGDNGCTNTASTVVTVNPLPPVASITGMASCTIGSTSQLSSATAGGVWSSSDLAVATVSASGLVTGIASGTVVITYAVTDNNGCTGSATINFTVPVPTITVSGSLNAFDACLGAPSQSQTIVVSGSGLTSNISVSAPAGYEVSVDNSLYASTLTLTQTAGTVSATTIYTRLTGVTAGSYSGTVDFVSAGAVSQTVSVSGTVYEPPTTAQAGADIASLLTGTTLAANNPTVGAGEWSIVSGTSTSTSQFTNLSLYNTAFDPDAKGTYVLRWTITSGTCSASTDEVVVKVADDIWSGAYSTDAGNAANWESFTVPTSSTSLDILISASAVNDLALGTDLTAGSIDFNGSGKKLILGSIHLTVGTLTATSSSSYVKTDGSGKLKMNLDNTAAKTFAIGTAYFSPVTITNNTGSAQEFYATVSDGVYTDGGTASTTTGVLVTSTNRVDLTWNLGNTTSSTLSGTVDLAFAWEAGAVTGTLTSPRLFHHDGALWQHQSGTTSASVLAGTLTYTGYSGSFSPFAIAEIGTALPVTWLSFTGRPVHGEVELNWSTASEQNNSHFEVERSADAILFNKIGRVNAAVNPRIRNDYRYLDQQPIAGRSFYRLKQVDLDGKFSYSSILQINGVPLQGVKAWMIPGTGQLTLQLPQSITAASSLQVYDASGRLVASKQVLPGINLIDLSRQSGGVYYVRVLQGSALLYAGSVVK